MRAKIKNSYILLTSESQRVVKMGQDSFQILAYLKLCLMDETLGWQQRIAAQYKRLSGKEENAETVRGALPLYYIDHKFFVL